MKRTQAPARFLGTLLLGAADQWAVANGTDATRTQLIAAALGTVVGGALKVHQVFRKDNRRGGGDQPHPWEDLAADTLLDFGGVVGGQVGAGLVMQQMQTGNQGTTVPVDTFDLTTDSGQTAAGAATQTGGAYAADSDSDSADTFEAA